MRGCGGAGACARNRTRNLDLPLSLGSGSASPSQGPGLGLQLPLDRSSAAEFLLMEAGAKGFLRRDLHPGLDQTARGVQSSEVWCLLHCAH